MRIIQIHVDPFYPQQIYRLVLALRALVLALAFVFALPLGETFSMFLTLVTPSTDFATANRGPSWGFSGELPFNRSFFCCVDLGSRRYVTEQKAADVVEEKVLGIGVGEVEAVVIDDLCLFL